MGVQYEARYESKAFLVSFCSVLSFCPFWGLSAPVVSALSGLSLSQAPAGTSTEWNLPARDARRDPLAHQGSHEGTCARKQQLTSRIALRAVWGSGRHCARRGEQQPTLISVSASPRTQHRTVSARSTAREEPTRCADGSIRRAPCTLSKQVIARHSRLHSPHSRGRRATPRRLTLHWSGHGLISRLHR